MKTVRKGHYEVSIKYGMQERQLRRALSRLPFIALTHRVVRIHRRATRRST